MPHSSAVYHLDFMGRIPPGQLVHAEDQSGAQVDIYLHPLHARKGLVWDLNWHTRHYVGHGLWRQNWTEGERMQEPAEGLGVAESRWEIVPAAEMPRDRHVFTVEQDGNCVWLIRAGHCTVSLERAMNRMLERIAGDGLWLQDWSDGRGEAGGQPVVSLAPPCVPPRVLV
jgi:hypothetical protein